MVRIETWRKIDGWDYSVSDAGRVRNDATGKFLKPIDAGNGYYRVRLYRDRVGTLFLLHRLVALAFIENPCCKPEINHIDGDRGNNVANNLEWCTRSENSIHRCRVLGHRNNPWKAMRKSVLCVETGKRYESIGDAAKDVGSHRPNISRAIERNLRAAGYHWRWATS